MAKFIDRELKTMKDKVRAFINETYDRPRPKSFEELKAQNESIWKEICEEAEKREKASS